jgi:hypothetical protein
MNRLLAGLLTLVLCANLLSQSSSDLSPQQKIAAQPVNTRLDIRTINGEKLSGKLLSHDEAGFLLATGSKGAPTQRSIPYASVAKVRAHPPTHTPLGAWIAVGLIAAVVVIVVAVFAIERHNEGG